MRRVIVLRHGRTDFNAANRVQGQYDSQLDDVGRAQADAAAAVLAGLSPTAIVSSDLRRAADTAAALATATGVPVSYDARLRERHFGEWQGLLLTEIAERFPDAYARWRAGEPEIGCGVEPLDDLMKRVAAGFTEAADAAESGVVVLVTHGGAARRGTTALLGWPFEVMRSLGDLANCHWSELRRDAVHGWQLRAHNVAAGTEPGPSR